mgnify:CR=1 FL=1
MPKEGQVLTKEELNAFQYGDPNEDPSHRDMREWLIGKVTDIATQAVQARDDHRKRSGLKRLPLIGHLIGRDDVEETLECVADRMYNARCSLLWPSVQLTEVRDTLTTTMTKTIAPCWKRASTKADSAALMHLNGEINRLRRSIP